jgi:hypothetical protein
VTWTKDEPKVVFHYPIGNSEQTLESRAFSRDRSQSYAKIMPLSGTPHKQEREERAHLSPSKPVG